MNIGKNTDKELLADIFAKLAKGSTIQPLTP